MRERLDCAVFSTACTTAWVGQWVGVHAGGRLHVRSLVANADIEQPDSCHRLLESAMQLRRYDVCLVPVYEDNLAWVRTSLSTAQGRLQTPVLALVRELKAAALNDLYALGLSDFVRDPLCPEELRVRVERLLFQRRYRACNPSFGRLDASQVGETTQSYSASNGMGPSFSDDQPEAELCSTILERTGQELDAFAAASALRGATSKESFRAAKSKVIERFERAYIAAALGRHSGNIAMAARAAQKHRRAFWALMRKYQIDAAPYRTESPPKLFPDG